VLLFLDLNQILSSLSVVHNHFFNDDACSSQILWLKI
jgi:hypothetical protein